MIGHERVKKLLLKADEYNEKMRPRVTHQTNTLLKKHNDSKRLLFLNYLSKNYVSIRLQLGIIGFLLLTILFKAPEFIFALGPATSLLISFLRTGKVAKNLNGHYFVLGFLISFSVAPFTYFLPRLQYFSPDANFYFFGVVLNFIFFNVILLQLRNLSRNKLSLNKSNLLALAISFFLALNFYQELIREDKKEYLLNYFIKSGWDNVAHFGIFNQIYLQGTNTKVASSVGSEIVGSGYPQHLHIFMAWMGRMFAPYSDSTESLYLFALVSFLFFGIVIICIFYSISSITGDKLNIFIPTASLAVGVLIYSSTVASYLAGWQTFFFSQLLAYLVTLLIYRSHDWGFRNYSRSLIIAALFCVLTNVWYLMGFVVIVLYATHLFLQKASFKNLVLVFGISLPALATPFYFLYPSVGVSALITGNSPGYSWRLFLLLFAIVALFGINDWAREVSKYARFALSALTATGLCTFGLFLYVQSDSSTTTYYLAKLIQGCFVILLACLTIILAEELIQVNQNFSKKNSEKSLTFAFSALMSFALLQSQVWIGPNFKNSTDYSHLNNNNANIRILLGPSQEAIRLLNVSNYIKNHEDQTLYISTFTTDPNNRLADLWARAMGAKWTYESERSSALLNNVSQSNTPSIIIAVKSFFNIYPEGKVILSASFYLENRDKLDSLKKSQFYLIDDFGREPIAG